MVSFPHKKAQEKTSSRNFPTNKLKHMASNCAFQRTQGGHCRGVKLKIDTNRSLIFQKLSFVCIIIDYFLGHMQFDKIQDEARTREIPKRITMSFDERNEIRSTSL